MATVSVRGRGAASAQPDEVTVGLTLPRAFVVHQEVAGIPLEAGEHELVAEIDVMFQLEQG
jgi:hypothetical protein